MIFVTVGTHEQQFNRLIEEIDRLKGNGTIKDEVIMQTGYCTYKPKYCKWSELLPYDQMLENVEKAIKLYYAITDWKDSDCGTTSEKI